MRSGYNISTVRELLVISVCLAALLIYFAAERVRLERSLDRVPRRIAVAGTRGKSGVARLVAAALRESGFKVLAKTTGSKPVIIFPDGSEKDIERPGPASVREQLRVIGLAARAGADVLVAEMMSIGGEGLSAEGRWIVRPQVLAMTNVRLDHIDAMGPRVDDVARTLTAAFPRNGTVLVPEEENHPVFDEAAGRRGSRLVPVPRDSTLRAERDSWTDVVPYQEFEPNIRLALAVVQEFGVERDTALRGMSRVSPDLGSLQIWIADFGAPPRRTICVNAFAANDPESSAEVLGLIGRRISLAGKSLLGVLSLREDRGDRTLQWIDAARAGFFRDFEHVAVVGAPARAAARKLRKALDPATPAFSFVPNPNPRELTDFIARAAAFEPVVIGLGNIVGPGERFVWCWKEAAGRHGG